jgi:hypothetical protein
MRSARTRPVSVVTSRSKHTGQNGQVIKAHQVGARAAHLAGDIPVLGVKEVSGVQWVPVADIAGLDVPAELPALADAAVQWAKTRE